MYIVLILLVIGLIFAYYSFKVTKKANAHSDKHPKGYYQSKGLAIGLAVGYFGMFIILLIFDQMDYFVFLAPGAGLLLGVILGYRMEKKHEDELRPLTEEELKMKKYLKIFLLIVVIIGFIFFFMVR